MEAVKLNLPNNHYNSFLKIDKFFDKCFSEDNFISDELFEVVFKQANKLGLEYFLTMTTFGRRFTTG